MVTLNLSLLSVPSTGLATLLYLYSALFDMCVVLQQTVSCLERMPKRMLTLIHRCSLKLRLLNKELTQYTKWHTFIARIT